MACYKKYIGTCNDWHVTLNFNFIFRPYIIKKKYNISFLVLIYRSLFKKNPCGRRGHFFERHTDESYFSLIDRPVEGSFSYSSSDEPKTEN